MKRLFILTGLLLLTGALFNRTIAQNRENQVREQSIKYQRLMAYIDAFYVDTVNLQKLTEDAIIKALSDLDPHSVYITKEEVDEMNEPLEGGFFGIGIQFTILRDTLAVVAIVPGRPFREGRIDGRRPDRFRGRREYRREKIIEYEGPEALERRGRYDCQGRRAERT